MFTKINKKIVLGIIALIFAAAFVVVSSFFPFIIDPGQWNSKEFISDMLIIVAIVMFTMVSAMNIGQASNAQDARSEIAKSKVKFVAHNDKVDNITRFCQWVRQVLQVNDLQSIKEREMRSVGIEDYSVLKLDITEIQKLQEGPQCFNGKYYATLTKRQVERLIVLKEGRLKITLVDPMYYLTVKSLDTERTITERSGSESVKKAVLITWSTFAKVVLTLVPLLIMAALVFDASQEGSTAQAAMKFISRMTAMLTSIFVGYILGCQINDIDAEYINMRVLVIVQYLQDTTFVGKTASELAKEAYDNLHRDEKQQLLLESLGDE